ncbi:23921_t:CDS:1, partial [Entrophospora sp. SA101]
IQELHVEEKIEESEPNKMQSIKNSLIKYDHTQLFSNQVLLLDQENEVEKRE